jgi:hypothetical protein
LLRLSIFAGHVRGADAIIATIHRSSKLKIHGGRWLTIYSSYSSYSSSGVKKKPILLKHC